MIVKDAFQLGVTDVEARVSATVDVLLGLLLRRIGEHADDDVRVHQAFIKLVGTGPHSPEAVVGVLAIWPFNPVRLKLPDPF